MILAVVTIGGLLLLGSVTWAAAASSSMILAVKIIGAILLLGPIVLAVAVARARQHTAEMPADETILPPPTRATRRLYGDP